MKPLVYQQHQTRELFNYLLKKLNIDAPEEELASVADIVMERLLHLSKVDVVSNKTIKLTTIQLDKLNQIINRLNHHEPVQYVFNAAIFYGQDLYVDQSVLIPRMETEMLVDIIIKSNQGSGLKILDIGTGSGCIALTLKQYLKDALVYGIDSDEQALNCAKINGERLQINIFWKSIDVLEQSIYKVLDTAEFDIIVSNPPYVLPEEMGLMKKNVLNFEPHQAIFVSKNHPLIFYKEIIDQSQVLLKPGGKIYFEINPIFGEEIKQILENTGFEKIRIIQDLNRRDRFMEAHRVKND